LFVKQKNWFEAAADCCKRSMRLITILDENEATCAKDLLAKGKTNYLNFALTFTDSCETEMAPNDWTYKLWISASDRGEEGEFKWCYPDRVDDFKDPPFVNWGSGEPNNDKGVENCLEVVTQYSNIETNDVPCNYQRSYICEVSVSDRRSVLSRFSWYYQSLVQLRSATNCSVQIKSSSI